MSDRFIRDLCDQLVHMGISPIDELSVLFSQWYQLTDEEGEAIDSSRWHRVASCQMAKSRIQPRIAQLSRVINVAEYKLRFGATLEELVKIEQQNQKRLEQKSEATLAQRRALDKASRNLRHVHQCYVPETRVHWQSYS